MNLVDSSSNFWKLENTAIKKQNNYYKLNKLIIAIVNKSVDQQYIFFYAKHETPLAICMKKKNKRAKAQLKLNAAVKDN